MGHCRNRNMGAVFCWLKPEASNTGPTGIQFARTDREGLREGSSLGRGAGRQQPGPLCTHLKVTSAHTYVHTDTHRVAREWGHLTHSCGRGPGPAWGLCEPHGWMKGLPVTTASSTAGGMVGGQQPGALEAIPGELCPWPQAWSRPTCWELAAGKDRGLVGASCPCTDASSDLLQPHTAGARDVTAPSNTGLLPSKRIQVA